MKKFILFLAILYVILLVGCSNSGETQTTIDNLNQKYTSLQTSNELLLKHQEELINDSKGYKMEIQNSNDMINKLNSQIALLNQQINNLKDEENNESAPTNNEDEIELVNIEELKVGDSLEGYRIKNVENTSKNFMLELDGCFILEGDFVAGDGNGTWISFEGTEYVKDQPFNSRIIINGDVFILSNRVGITNDTILKEELGEGLYTRVVQEGIKVHAIAVYNYYKLKGYVESEYGYYAELVSIIDMEAIAE